MLSQTALPARVARGPSSSRLSAATFPHTRSTQKRTVIVRFKESDHENVDALKQELEQQLQQDAQAQDLKQQPLQPLFAPSEPKLSPQQYKEVSELLLPLLLLMCCGQVAYSLCSASFVECYAAHPSCTVIAHLPGSHSCKHALQLPLQWQQRCCNA